jgi:nucleoside-diphosphate-sugar epimerase
VHLPVKLLETAARHGTGIFINTDTDLDRDLNDYTRSKHRFFEKLEPYSGQFKLINMKIDHLYGPKDDDTRFVPFIIHRFLRNEAVIELTRGEQQRDFIYVTDLVAAYLRVLESLEELSGGLTLFEAGSGTTVTVKDLVLTIQQLTGNTKTKLLFGALPYREHELMQSNIDISALVDLGWHPAFPLEEGLKRTIDEFTNRRDN